MDFDPPFVKGEVVVKACLFTVSQGHSNKVDLHVLKCVEDSEEVNHLAKGQLGCLGDESLQSFGVCQLCHEVMNRVSVLLVNLANLLSEAIDCIGLPSIEVKQLLNLRSKHIYSLFIDLHSIGLFI